MLDEAEQELLNYKGQGLTSAQMEEIMKIPASTLRSRMRVQESIWKRHCEKPEISWAKTADFHCFPIQNKLQ